MNVHLTLSPSILPIINMADKIMAQIEMAQWTIMADPFWAVAQIITETTSKRDLYIEMFHLWGKIYINVLLNIHPVMVKSHSSIQK